MAATPSEGGFRPDVEGLRAVALAVMLLTHAGLSSVQGGYAGVDVFFVISGYLITRMIMGEIGRSGTVSLLRFYARRAKRLLPLSFTVLAAVAALSGLILSPVAAENAGRDVIAAAIYLANWHFAAESVDYFAADIHASPVQHFWTLSIEEQFYLVWPAFLLLVTRRARRRGGDPRLAIAVGLGVLAAASFAYAVHMGLDDRPDNYFNTFTRAWEFTVGGAAALVLSTRFRLSPALAGLAAWIGLGSILAASALFDYTTPVPGFATLMPTVGAAMLIVAGSTSLATLPARFLQLGPVRYMGRISYSWYMWHWPPLVLAGAMWGDLSVPERLLVIGVSGIPASVTHHLIERPFHHSPTLSRFPRRSLALGFSCTTAGVVCGLMVMWSAPTIAPLSEEQASGADALRQTRTIQDRADALRPTPRRASGDRSRMYDDGCLVEVRETRSPPCVYGDARSDTTIVLFGDSQAMHWFPAVDRVARRHGWRLLGLTKAGCPPAATRVYNRQFDIDYAQCDEWRERTLRRIERERPALVIATGGTSYDAMRDGERLGFAATRERLHEGYIATLRRLRATGAQVAVVGDTPRAPGDVPECVSESRNNLRRCAFDLEEGLRRPLVNDRAARRVGDVALIDPVRVLCHRGRCPAVIGDVLVFRDNNHLSATYARTLGPWLDRQLRAAGAWPR